MRNGDIIKTGSDSVASEAETSWFEEKDYVDFNDQNQVDKALSDFEKRYANSDKEHCIIITTSGKIYEAHGGKWTVDTSILGDKMKGSINEHNHVYGESHYSFSREDLFSSVNDGSAIVCAFDEKYRYKMNLCNVSASQEQVHSAYRAAVEEVNELKFLDYLDGGTAITFDNEQHEIISRTCERLGVLYERFEK